VFEPNDMLQKMTLDVLGRAVFDYDFKYMNRYGAQELWCFAIS